MAPENNKGKTGLNFKLRDFGADAADSGAVYTTSNGVRMPNPAEAQRVGENGPLLLQDFHLLDLISHFDRERIPERVVHAKGAGAHGTFTCTKSLKDLCMTGIFAEEGKSCPVTVRFSTVGGESGSLDAARDPRGFSIKHRTDEGNMDWVFNNTPIFFLRDPALFPLFIHTQKRHPQTHLTHAQDSTAFWDYLSQNPEAVHQFMILMGDRGIPSSYATMNGYSSHTFKLVNDEGEWVYAQFHIMADEGVKTLTNDEAAKLPPDSHTQDLFERIESGKFPTWTYNVQTMTPKQAEQSGINVFDLTKVWPHKEFPLREFGKLVLDSNPANYFSEVELAAFNPAHLLPGIEPSADPVLQSRLFSYPDAHRYRIGSNYQQLPVNQTNTPYLAGNFQRDGQMAYYNQGARPNYMSSLNPIKLSERKYGIDKVHAEYMGNAIAYLSSIRKEDFDQPRALWTKVFDAGQRERITDTISGHMANVSDPEIIKRCIGIFYEVHEEFGRLIEKKTGCKDAYHSIEGMKFTQRNEMGAGVNATNGSQNDSTHK
ncbi:catalase-like domain-containing protein [Protomyces lactucae-debilis]|uniref:Catalase n=1 Tax=Protomyces lactucae-debilis TaxID=2754530 RepID=A0A1Y2FBT9_PROLT|nr:catalase-like domain-containing protein [Protomyces lactucae-debilis]ORY80325.1 catalase-like domain-containing protein [Protomyces lactucae-debilis]